MLYIIGSLRNPNVPIVANAIRKLGIEVWDDWYAAGEKADESWQAYEQARGHTYITALNGYPANHVFNYDRYHLERSAGGVLVLPAGKSAHLELGYLLGQGKPGYILLEGEPERYDVMYNFARVFLTMEDLLQVLWIAKQTPPGQWIAR